MFLTTILDRIPANMLLFLTNDVVSLTHTFRQLENLGLFTSCLHVLIASCRTSSGHSKFMIFPDITHLVGSISTEGARHESTNVAGALNLKFYQVTQNDLLINYLQKSFFTVITL